MKAKTNKLKEAVVATAFLGTIGMLFLAFIDNQDYYTGIFGTTASAQPMANILPVQTESDGRASRDVWALAWGSVGSYTTCAWSTGK